MLHTTGPLVAPPGLVTGRGTAYALRRLLPDLLPAGEPGVIQLRECGQILGNHRGRRRWNQAGRPVGGRKICTSTHGCPVHAPMRARDTIDLAHWYYTAHMDAGLPVVSWVVSHPHGRVTARNGLALVDEVVRAVTRKRSTSPKTVDTPFGPVRYEGRPAPHTKLFRRYRPVGWVAFLHMPWSPTNGWLPHAHLYAFLTDLPDGADGFETALRTATVTEFQGRVRAQSPMTDGFYVGSGDEDGRRAMVVETVDDDGWAIWVYHSIHDPEHPDNPGSRFHDEYSDLRLDRAFDHFEFAPDSRPSLDPWAADDRDPVWAAALESWHRTSGASTAKPFEILRDLGGLTLAGSPTAAGLYREAVLGTAGHKRCIISSSLKRLYPPPSEVTDWACPDDTTAVLMGNGVAAAVDHAQRAAGWAGPDVLRSIETLLADGDLHTAVARIREWAGPNIHLVRDRDGLPVIQFGRKEPV